MLSMISLGFAEQVALQVETDALQIASERARYISMYLPDFLNSSLSVVSLGMTS